MKYFFIFLLTCFYLGLDAQSITASDILLLNKAKDINLINNFLIRDRNFKYTRTEKEGDWDKVYVFNKGEAEIKVYLGSGIVSGKYEIITQIIYSIKNQDEYEYFIRSLHANKFKITSEDKDDSGVPFTLWQGTSLTDMFDVIVIRREPNCYVVLTGA